MKKRRKQRWRKRQKRAAPIKEITFVQEEKSCIEKKQQDIPKEVSEEKRLENQSIEKTIEKQPNKLQLQKRESNHIQENQEETFGQIVQRLSKKKKESQETKIENDFFIEKKEIKKDSDGELILRKKRRKRLKYRQREALKKTVKNNDQKKELKESFPKLENEFGLKEIENTTLFFVNKKDDKKRLVDKQENQRYLAKEEISIKKQQMPVNKEEKQRKQQKQRKQRKMQQRKLKKEKNRIFQEQWKSKEVVTEIQPQMSERRIATSGQFVQRLENPSSDEKIEIDKDILKKVPEEIISLQKTDNLKKENQTEVSAFSEYKKDSDKKTFFCQEESDKETFFEEKKEKSGNLPISVQDTRRKRMLQKQREAIQKTKEEQKEEKQEKKFSEDTVDEKTVLLSESENNDTDFSEEKNIFEQEMKKNSIEKQRIKNTYYPSELKIDKKEVGKIRRNQIAKKREQREKQKNQKFYQEKKKREIEQKRKEINPFIKESLESDIKTEEQKKTTNTLEFLPSKKLGKLQEQAKQAEKRVEQAQRKWKRKKEFHWTRVWEESSGKAKYCLTIVEVEKPPVSKNPWGQGIQWIEMQGNAYFHGKVAEVEEENTAVKAAHKTEQLVETIYGDIISHRKTNAQRQKEAFQKLQKKQTKTEQRVQYQQFLEENPEFSKKEMRKRMQQIHRKQEVQKARQQAEILKEGKEFIIKASDTFALLARKSQEVVRNHIIAFGSFIIFGFLLMMVMTLVSSCSFLVGNVVSSSLMGCYFSDPKEIEKAELYFTKLEAELAKTIDTIEETYPGYQEYQYSIDPIGHDPFALISFLSAVYTEISFEEVENEIETLFTQLYSLTITPSVTTTMVSVPVYDEYGNLQYQLIPQTVAYLTVTLTKKSWEELMLEVLNEEQIELYEIYQETKGGLQQFSSPVEMAWDTSIHNYYGYRQNKETGQIEFHQGMDIEGAFMDIYAAHSGIVSAVGYEGDLGNWLSITDTQGITIRYAHMETIFVMTGEEIVEGTFLGKTGNIFSETNGEVGFHLEVFKDGVYYNPIFYFASGR